MRKAWLFPFRLLSAYRNAPSLRWGAALEAGLDASLANVSRGKASWPWNAPVDRIG